MRPACPKCRAVHHPMMTRAVGRFDPHSPTGYKAEYQDAPLRGTRDEAITDMCKWMEGRKQ